MSTYIPSKDPHLKKKKKSLQDLIAHECQQNRQTNWTMQ